MKKIALILFAPLFIAGCKEKANEQSALPPANTEWQTNVPAVKAEIQRTKGKKKEANRVLPLTENAIKALEILKKLSEGSEYVVTNNVGNTIDTNKYNSWIKRYCDKAGIREHSSHDSRRYAISAMLYDGMPLEAVKDFAGHLDASTTESYARRIHNERFRETFVNALK